MKSPIPDRIAKVRTDITSYLFHFVNRDGKPADILRAILRCGFIRGSISPPSETKTVSFTEAPLAEILKQNGILDSHNYKRLSLWGIGFRKDYIFGTGGLPVVYQPRHLLSSLQENAQWRHVDFDLLNGIDFTWQREWRVKTEEFHFESEHAILVIPNVAQFAGDLWKVSIDAEYEDGEISLSGGVFKKWDFIPLDHVDLSNDSSIDVCRGKDFADLILDDYYDDIEFDGP